MRPLDEAEAGVWPYLLHVARVRSVVRLERSRPGSADAVLAVVLAALAELEIWTLDSSDPPRPVLAAAALVAMLALAWRRRAPLASATVALGAIALLSAFWRLDGAWPAFAFLVALYSVAMHSELRPALIGAGLGLTAGALGTLAEDNDSIGAFLGNYSLLAVV